MRLMTQTSPRTSARINSRTQSKTGRKTGCKTWLDAMGVALLAIVAVLLAPAAAAQTRDVEPYFVAVVDENTLLRSGDLRSYYPIATIEPGTILRVTGEGERWLRVEYPDGLHALVRADHATLDQARGVVTLSRTGALKALSDTRYGVDGSFRDVQGPDTPATTQLKHHRTETSSRGIVFYVVDAPRGAAGFIETAQARRATPSEIREHLASLEQASDREESQGEGRGPTDTRDQTPAGAQAPETTDERANEPADEQTPTLMEPMRVERTPTPPNQQPEGRQSGNQPAQARPSQTDPAQTPREMRDEQPTNQNPRQPEGRGATQTPERGDALQPLPSLEALSAAFDAVRRQGTLEAEVDELVAAFNRVLANTPDTEDNASTRAWLQQRLSLLEIRKRVQQNLQEIAEARARLEAGNAQSAEAMARLEAGRIYDFVGRLERSAVYNGDRLPLMYRLVSVGDGIPRTLGYIEPAEGLNLDRKLGVLVGVSGASTTRADLRLSTIDANSVVVLRSEETDNVQFATEPDDG